MTENKLREEVIKEFEEKQTKLIRERYGDDFVEEQWRNRFRRIIYHRDVIELTNFVIQKAREEKDKEFAEMRKGLPLTEAEIDYTIGERNKEIADLKAEREKQRPIDKCSKCGNKLNVWLGSHTCVRVVIMGKEIKWMCTKCWDEDTREDLLDEIEKIALSDEYHEYDKETLGGDDRAFRLAMWIINNLRSTAKKEGT